MRTSGPLLCADVSQRDLSRRGPGHDPAGHRAGRSRTWRSGPRSLPATIVACTDLPTTATAPPRDCASLASHTGDHPLELCARRRRGAQRRHAAGVRRRPALLRPSSATQSHGRTAERRGAARRPHVRMAHVDRRRRAVRRWRASTIACDVVLAGDYLEPFVEPAAAQHGRSPTARPTSPIWGACSSGADRRQSFGAGDVLSIDRGKAQGHWRRHARRVLSRSLERHAARRNGHGHRRRMCRPRRRRSC